MPLFRKSNSRVSSRRQIAIKGVEDGILVLPGNKYRAVLRVSSINLELKSEAEQDTIVETYQSFLNSLACPVQILIQIREVDIDGYLESYRQRLKEERETIYKKQIEGYTDFVRKLIKTNKILTRHFYLVVPYEDNDKSSMAIIRDQLNLQVNIIERGLSKLGMQARPLGSLEVLDLFYGFYNPEHLKLQPLTMQTMHMLEKEYI